MDIDELLDQLDESPPGSPTTAVVVNPVAETPAAANSPSAEMSPAEITVDVDEQLERLGNQIRTVYAPRLPELQALVPDLQEFCTTITVLGPLLTADSAALAAVIGKQRAMVLQMSIAENKSRELTPQEWDQLQDLLKTANFLFDKRKAAMAVLADELQACAPNLLEIIGLPTAVRLVAYRGGLGELAATPSANLVGLGAPKAPGAGQAVRVAGQPRQGIVYNDNIVRSVPIQHKIQAIRLVCAKIVLAARVDLARGSPTGEQGRLWRSQIMDRLEKLATAPLSAQDRALPVPEDKPSKKRGGRRARRLKQQLTPTELQRQRDRLAFGKANSNFDP